jgi:ComF family protein
MLKRILYQLYPSICVLCGGRGQGHRPLCGDCEQDLPENSHACTRCACPLPLDVDARLCARCLQQAPPFDQAWSPFLYAQPLEWMIHQFKFNAKLYMGRLLADMVIARLPVRPDPPECIIPVPLHPRRLRQRGFNQSMELAHHLGTALAVPVDDQHCHKIIHTSAQTGKTARQRRRNVRHAFRFDNRPQYRHVVLLDDVITTGSTVSELARVLRAQGVRRVDAWSIARAPFK